MAAPVSQPMPTRASIPTIRMKAFPSSSPSSSSTSSTNRSVEAVTVEYELRLRRKYLRFQQTGGGRRQRRVVERTDPEAEVRTFRPSSPNIFDYLFPLYPSTLFASFGIAEDDISLSSFLREDIFCFVCNAVYQAKLSGNDRLKIVFAAVFFHEPPVLQLAPSPPEPEHDDPDLQRALRESSEIEERERSTSRRRRRLSDEEESIVRKLKKVKYESSSSDSRHCFSDCRICLEEFLGEEELSLMPCGHAFHSPCILRWLSTADSCPTCRFHLC